MFGARGQVVRVRLGEGVVERVMGRLGGDPQEVLHPQQLPAGSEAMLEITGLHTNFSDGRTIAGFGSSDVLVQRIWVLGPDRLLMNVRVSATAKPGGLPLTVITGFQTATLANALEIQHGLTEAPIPDPTLTNPATGPRTMPHGPTTMASTPYSIVGCCCQNSQCHIHSHVPPS